jgi:hypothetical protein
MPPPGSSFAAESYKDSKFAPPTESSSTPSSNATVHVYIQTQPSNCICPHHTYDCRNRRHTPPCTDEECLSDRSRVELDEQTVHRAKLPSGEYMNIHEPFPQCFEAGKRWCTKGQPMMDTPAEHINTNHSGYKDTIKNNQWEFGAYLTNPGYRHVATTHGACACCRSVLLYQPAFTVVNTGTDTVVYCGRTDDCEAALKSHMTDDQTATDSTEFPADWEFRTPVPL